MKKNLLKVSLTLGLLLTQAGMAFAQINIKDPGNIPTYDIGHLIGAVVGLAIIVAGLLAFLYLVWGGIEWISSGGDKAGMEAARNRITAAFVGLAIVASAWAITKLIETFFNISILGGTIVVPNIK